MSTSSKRPAKAQATTSAPVAKKASVTKKPTVETVVVVQTQPTSETVVEQSTTTDEELGKMDCEYEKVDKMFTNLKHVVSTLHCQQKKAFKQAKQELKMANKLNEKRKKKNKDRKPSGFIRPTKISTELATFLSRPPGTEMARTKVTTEINQYVRTHNLQDPTNGRIIRPDAKLLQLLTPLPDPSNPDASILPELTYFNLQRFLGRHFQKVNGEPVK